MALNWTTNKAFLYSNGIGTRLSYFLKAPNNNFFLCRCLSYFVCHSLSTLFVWHQEVVSTNKQWQQWQQNCSHHCHRHPNYSKTLTTIVSGSYFVFCFLFLSPCFSLCLSFLFHHFLLSCLPPSSSLRQDHDNIDCRRT